MSIRRSHVVSRDEEDEDSRDVEADGDDDDRDDRDEDGHDDGLVSMEKLMAPKGEGSYLPI